jgi:membrane protein implicated in regulation of membrane protease activity
MDNSYLLAASGLKFWGWLSIAALLLGLELFLGTQWLLWMASAATIVAIMGIMPLPWDYGLVAEILTFCVISIGLIIITSRNVRPLKDNNINEPTQRLLGKRAEIVSGFELITGGVLTGRVSFEDVVWPADLKLDQGQDFTPLPSQSVEIVEVYEGRLIVKPLNSH